MVHIRAFLLALLLLLCKLVCASTAPPAHAPAPATGLLLPEDLVCLGIGTSHQTLACLAKVSSICLAAGAVTDEAAYTPCFILGVFHDEECLARPPKGEKSCIGIPVSDQLAACFGAVGWTCRASNIFVACYVGTSISRCL